MMIFKKKEMADLDVLRRNESVLVHNTQIFRAADELPFTSSSVGLHTLRTRVANPALTEAQRRN